MKTIKTELECPNCGMVGNRQTTLAEAEDGHADIQPGDIGICASCLEPFYYGEGGTALALNEEQAAEIADDPVVQDILGMLEQIRNGSKKQNRLLN